MKDNDYKDLSIEEIDLLINQTIKENNEVLSTLKGELSEFDKFKDEQQKFYKKFGFSEEFIENSKNPPISENELDDDIQAYFDHFFKELAAEKAANSDLNDPKKKRTNIKVSRRGMQI